MNKSSDTDKPESADDEGLYFLRDDPADITEDGEFGHHQYVQTIAETVREVEPPWQIALYGRWGTGKSSILDAVEEELETEGSANEFVEFDAWKHAEDSIRTEFLLTLNRKLGADSPVLPPEDIEEKLLDVSVTETTQSDEKADGLSLERLKQWLWPQILNLYRHFRDNIVVIGAILLFVAAHQIVTQLQTPIPNTIWNILLLTFAGGALATELFKGIGGKNTYQRMENPREGWSGAYETLFKKILKKHGEDNGSPEQYVIAIDNLDRCEPQAVYDVLISMKTFFGGEDSDCVYIVPCDADRLRDHVSAANIVDGEKDLVEEEPKDEDEFLRKFFQTTIHLPPLEVPNLHSFANDQFANLQAERRPDDQAAVVDVLMKLKSPTPRRVKHLINRFVSYLKLAERLEDAWLMKYNTVTENEPFLMKTLILQEDYNLIYRYIRSQPGEYTDLEELAASEYEANSENPVVASDGGTSTRSAAVDESEQQPPTEHDETSLTQQSLEDLVRENPAVLEFLQDTSEYDEEDPKPFFYLGDASFAEVFGRYNQVKDALENGDAEQAAKALDKSYNDSDGELEQFVADLYSRKVGGGIADSTTIATGFELLGSLEESAQKQTFSRVFASKLDESTLEKIIGSFDPHGVWATVWQGYIDDQDTVDVRPVIEYALSDALQEQGSAPRVYFTAMLQTIGDAETGSKRALANNLRDFIASRVSEEPAETVRGVAMTLNTLDHPRRASQAVMTNELHKALRDVLPAVNESGVNADVFDVLLEVDPVLDQAPGIQSPEPLTREFFTSVTDACLESSDGGAPTYETVGQLRHADLSRLEPNNPVVWKVHTIFARHVQPAEVELPPEVLSLLDLWLDLLDEDLLPYGQPEAEIVEGLNDWSDELTVENTFTGLLSIDSEADRIRVSDGLIAEHRTLSVLNKNQILTAYLKGIPELVEDENVIAALELADAGELAPLEEYLLKVCKEGESLGRWASIMVALPEKAVGAREELVEECITAASEPGATNTAFVEYPALQWDIVREHPVLQERYIEVLERGFATGQRNAQSMTAAALSQLADGVEIKPQLVRRAIETVRREYERGERPATALNKFVGRQLAAGTIDEVPASADLESLAGWRAEFVRTDNPEEDRREVLKLLIAQFETYPDQVDSAILQSVVDALEDEYPTERLNPFAEECQQIRELEAQS